MHISGDKVSTTTQLRYKNGILFSSSLFCLSVSTYLTGMKLEPDKKKLKKKEEKWFVDLLEIIRTPISPPPRKANKELYLQICYDDGRENVSLECSPVSHPHIFFACYYNFTMVYVQVHMIRWRKKCQEKKTS